MTEYISRQGLRERLGIDPDGYCEKCRYRGMFGCNQSNEHLRACEAIDDEPAADVRPMVRGKWEKHEDFDPYGGGRFVEWVCSECDKRLRGDWVIRNSNIEETPTENYCPNCGCQMNGGRK